MSAYKLAKRYAKAVIGIAEEKSEIRRVLEDIESISCLAHNDKAMNLLAHPEILVDKKINFLNQFFNAVPCTDTMKNALFLMLKKKRIAILEGFVTQLTVLSDLKLHRMRIKITVSEKKDLPLGERIKKNLEEKTKCEIIAENNIDPGIIGGIIVQNGSHIFDGSIKNKLDSLAKNFI